MRERRSGSLVDILIVKFYRLVLSSDWLRRGSMVFACQVAVFSPLNPPLKREESDSFKQQADLSELCRSASLKRGPLQPARLGIVRRLSVLETMWYHILGVASAMSDLSE